MKTTIKALLLATVVAAATGCIKEVFPENDFMTADQVQKQEEAIKGYINSLNARMVDTYGYSSNCDWDFGYPSFGLVNDLYCEDMATYSTAYDYHYWYGTATYLGEYTTSDWFWESYYDLISRCNGVLRVIDEETQPVYGGIARFYRSFYYFDMARRYEWKDTGFEALDQAAESNGVKGLTVPIVTEKTTEAEARNTPRAPWYEMYKFIIDDLKTAEAALQDYERPKKNLPNVAVVNGQLARVYLDLASRYEQNAEAASEASAAGVDLGAADARGFYSLAIEAANTAIRNSNSPLTKEEWYGGFNKLSTPAWMLGLIINKELVGSSYVSWISSMSPCTSFGLAGIAQENGNYENQYTAQRTIAEPLYNSIPRSDWRKASWIAPEDAGDESKVDKYSVQIPGAMFAKIPQLTTVKFSPKNGEIADYSIASAVDYPLMRVEEMYLIRAEAEAGVNGVQAGINSLSDFVRTFRDANYSYTRPETQRDFIKELIRQKRIEFWGEGLLAWDYKRLNLAITRKYEGSTFPEAYQINSRTDHCAPWLNTYIQRSERGKNPALKMNPDPSDYAD